jgi:hypothetical protein
MTSVPSTVFSWEWVSVLQSVLLIMVMFLLSVLLRPLPKCNCRCYLHLMTLGILCDRMLHYPFFRSNTLDHLYPDTFVDFRFLIVLGNNKQTSYITSVLIICKTYSLIRSVASSQQGPVIVKCNINNIISEGWLMNMFLSHIFPCTLKKKFMHFQ